jgi:MoxR-like ATPase
MGDFARGIRIAVEDVDGVAVACTRFRDAFNSLRREVGTVVVGQEAVVEQTLVALFAGGHVLLEGVPGLGKTLLVQTISDALGLDFSRIQFTPDLMPADITGTTIVVEDESGARSFRFRPGPIFANIVLADEINRATPKSQSAMLEAMQERAVSTGDRTRSLPDPFLVLATQNPIEQEGTHPLPEAQLDRFLFKVSVPYAVRGELMEILRRTTSSRSRAASPVLDGEDILAARSLSRRVLISPSVQDYAIRLVMATHPEGDFAVPAFRNYIRMGASPRAAQALVSTARVLAIMDGRYAASVEDIRRIALPVLRHRIIRTFEAEADGVEADDLVTGLLERLPVDPAHPEEGIETMLMSGGDP